MLTGTFHKGSRPPRTRHPRPPRPPGPLPPARRSHTRGSCSSAARSSMRCLHSLERSEEGEKGPFSGFFVAPMCCSVCRECPSPQAAPGAGAPWGRTAEQPQCPAPAQAASRGARTSLPHVHNQPRAPEVSLEPSNVVAGQRGAGPLGDPRAGMLQLPPSALPAPYRHSPATPGFGDQELRIFLLALISAVLPCLLLRRDEEALAPVQQPARGAAVWGQGHSSGTHPALEAWRGSSLDGEQPLHLPSRHCSLSLWSRHSFNLRTAPSPPCGQKASASASALHLLRDASPLGHPIPAPSWPYL